MAKKRSRLNEKRAVPSSAKKTDLPEEEWVDEPEHDDEGAQPQRLFSLPIMVECHQMRQRNGQNAYERYRNYCSRRMRRLRNSLKFKNARGRFRRRPYPKVVPDRRYLMLPLLAAERAWAYSMEYQQKNALLSAPVAKIRRKCKQKLRKAEKHARDLVKLAEKCGNRTTGFEARGYHMWISTLYHLEMKRPAEALRCCLAFETVFRLLRRFCTPGSPAEIVYGLQIEEGQTSLRICQYQLARQGADVKSIIRSWGNAVAPKALGGDSGDGNGLVVMWRGKSIELPSSTSADVKAAQEIYEKFRIDVDAMVQNAKSERPDEAAKFLAELTQNYDRIVAQCSDSLKSVNEKLLDTVKHEWDANTSETEDGGDDVSRIPFMGGSLSQSLSWTAASAYVKELGAVAAAERSVFLLRRKLAAAVDDQIGGGSVAGPVKPKGEISDHLMLADEFSQILSSLGHSLNDGDEEYQNVEDLAALAETFRPKWHAEVTMAAETAKRVIREMEECARDVRGLANALKFAETGRYAEAFAIVQHVESRMAERETLKPPGKEAADLATESMATTRRIFSLLDQYLKDKVGPLMNALLVQAARKVYCKKLKREEKNMMEARLDGALAEVNFPPQALVVPQKPVFYDLAFSNFDPPSISVGPAGVMGKLSSWWGK